MKNHPITADELDTFVAIAYGGSAYRAGRKAQARALGNLFRGKPLDSTCDKPRSVKPRKA